MDLSFCGAWGKPCPGPAAPPLRPRHVSTRLFLVRRVGRSSRRAGRSWWPITWRPKVKLQVTLQICAIAAVVWKLASVLMRRQSGALVEMAISDFLDFLQQPGTPVLVRHAILGTSQCILVLADGRQALTKLPMTQPAISELWSLLRSQHITIVTERARGLSHAATSGFVMLAYLGIVFAMMRWTANGGRGQGWGDMRKKVLQAEQSGTVTRFDDIAGIDKAKQEVQEVVEMLKSPGRYAVLGARVPRGVLMVGPPGSGKTLLARACAAEAGLPFLSAAATEFVELFVGRGAARVRQLFDQAQKLAPCILFIDEIDALRARSSDMLRMGGNQEAEQTLNQLLTCMDGLVKRDKPIVVVGATNRPEVLDEALLRPGRFDRVVQVPLPDAVGRELILRVHLRLKNVPQGPDVEASLPSIALRCEGLAGAALEALINEAAIRAARRGAPMVASEDLEEALENYRTSRQGTRPGFPWL